MLGKTKNPGGQSAPQKNKYLVIALLCLPFVLCLYLIFGGSGEQAPATVGGLNFNIPDGRTQNIEGNKQKAMEREQMNEQTQAMCFMAGANSIFYGCKLLTTPNPEEDKDLQLFRKLGLNPQQTAVLAGDNEQQQRLEQALMTPDTDEYYNAAAL